MTPASCVRPLLCALFALAASGTSTAALTSYTAQSSFLGAVHSAGTDTYDDVATDVSTPSPMARSAGSNAYTASASTLDFFGAGAAPDIWLSTDQFDDTITFSGFGSGISAIGGFFFGSDIFGTALAGQSLIFDVTENDGTQDLTHSFTVLSSGSSSFQGWVSTGRLVSLSITAVQTNDTNNIWATVNDLVLAVGNDGGGGGGGGGGGNGNVPEPTSLALALAALAAVGSRTRRRR